VTKKWQNPGYNGAAHTMFRLMLNHKAGLKVDLSAIESSYLDPVLDLKEAVLANKYPGLLYEGWQNDFAAVMNLVKEQYKK
jgi:hypothetical protein